MKRYRLKANIPGDLEAYAHEDNGQTVVFRFDIDADPYVETEFVRLPLSLLEEVKPAIPDEPEPGAYMIGETLCWHNEAYGWLVGHRADSVWRVDWCTWVDVWAMVGGPDVTIQPLVAMPEVDLPWTDDVRLIEVRAAVGCGCAGEPDGERLVDVAIGDNDRRLDASEARVLAAALWKAAGGDRG